MKDIDDCSRLSVGKEQNEILVASVARWEEHQMMLIRLEQKCQELCQVIEQMSERQELLAALMESKKSPQKEAPEEFHRRIFQELKEL